MNARKHKITEHVAHHRAFLFAWMRAPRMVGAVIPSGRRLTRMMAGQVRKDHAGWVIEIGAGTGAVTQALIDAGVDPARMLVIERDPLLYHRLVKHFPRLHIVHADAIALKQILKERQVGAVHTILSGIPFLTIPHALAQKLLAEMTDCLVPGGQIIQFTYGLNSSIPLRTAERLKLSSQRLARIWRNLPPASIWVYRKEN